MSEEGRSIECEVALSAQRIAELESQLSSLNSRCGELDDIRMDAVSRRDKTITVLESQLRTQATEHSLANRRLEDEIGRLRDAIEECEVRFRAYAAIHAINDDSEKAEGDRRMADLCQQALSPSPPAVEQPACSRCGKGPFRNMAEWINHKCAPPKLGDSQFVPGKFTVEQIEAMGRGEKPVQTEEKPSHLSLFEQKRRAFEAWAKRVGLSIARDSSSYVSQKTTDAWYGWLAACRALASTEEKAATVPLAVAEKLAEALRGFRDALSDGPENCSMLKYEEVDAIADSALAAFQASTKE
jgi:hypothetical protein